MQRVTNSLAKKGKVISKKPDRIKKNNLILTLLQMAFIIAICISVEKVVRWNILNTHSKKELEESREAITYKNDSNEAMDIDFNKLKEINPDIVGWIKVPGTNIDYPIVQSQDNDFYLHHSLDKKTNNAGWVFLDYRNNLNDDKNTIIYGHNRKDGSIFGSLKKVLQKSWYENKDNLKIELWTENSKSIYDVFSIYEIQNEEYYISTYFDDYMKFIDDIKNRSKKDFNVVVDEDDSILTLSTCSNTIEQRVVLHAVKNK